MAVGHATATILETYPVNRVLRTIEKPNDVIGANTGQDTESHAFLKFAAQLPPLLMHADKVLPKIITLCHS